MPNAENINRVIVAIQNEERTPLKFDMENILEPVADPQPGCGTAACIMGFAGFIEHGQEVFDMEDQDIEESAMEFLGLTYDEAQDLFYTVHSDVELRDITPAMAIQKLIHLRDTGELIDWEDTDAH